MKWLMEQMEKDWDEAMDKILLKGNGAEPPEVETPMFYYEGVPVYMDTESHLPTKEQ